MDEKRRGEIAVMLMKHTLRQKGVSLGTDFNEQITREADELGITKEELTEFIEPIVREMVDEMFKKKRPDLGIIQ